MLKTFASLALGAAIALTPLAAHADTALSAPGAHPATHHTRHYTGSYRSEMRKRHNSSKERARASAEHMRMMRSQ